MNNEEIKMKCWNDIDRALKLKEKLMKKDFDEKLEELRSYFLDETTMYQGKKIHEVINRIFGLK
jgi:Zn-dependent oligopeptidase